MTKSVGQSTQRGSLCYGMTPLLWKIAVLSDIPKKEKAPPKEKKKRSQCKMSDDDVAHARWLSEEQGVSATILAKKYSMSVSGMRTVLGYITRANIKPKRME